MANDTTLTLVGNLVADPELRFTPNGAAVANFTIASTPRFYDKQSNQWQDGEALFVRCSIWREAAENVAESLTKGARVIAEGRLKARTFDTKEGEKRTVWELEVDEVGPSLRFATASVQRANRQQNTAPAQSQQAPPGSWTEHYAKQGAAPAEQPVAAGGWGGAPAGDGWGGGF